MSSVMATMATAAAMAKPPVCRGPSRLKQPMATIATTAHSPGESHATSLPLWPKPK
jgi:hypothetical protein